MAKKFTTVRLIVILVVLLLIYAGTEFYSNQGRSESFKEELVEIDTASVTKVILTNQAKKLLLEESEAGWSVSTDGGNIYTAMPARVNGALSALLTVIPSRVATRNEAKWQEFQVDSSGMRVEVFEENSKTLDLVIGRFGMQGQQQFYSYVRLFEAPEVYVAENFMGFSISGEESNYRNQTITKFSKDSVQQINFSYPGDSSFSIERSIDGSWVSGQLEMDSTSTAQFIRTLSSISSSKFDNDFKVTTSSIPEYICTINLTDGNTVQIEGFTKSDSLLVISSSQNEEARFIDDAVNKKLFPSLSSLTASVD